LWRWSNLDTNKALIQRQAAMLGTVGLRIDARADADPLRRKVRIRRIHPGDITDFDEDADGNVTAVKLEYSVMVGPLGGQRDSVPFEEIITKDEYMAFRDGKPWDMVTNAPGGARPNTLGVCPVVLLRHLDNGGEYGVPAMFGSEEIIHLLNWMVSTQNESVLRHVFPQWAAITPGASPKTYDMGRNKVVHIQTRQGDPASSIQAMVAALDQAGATNFWQACREALWERQPEMILGNLKTLSGQSGETIANLLKPCEQAIELAKTNYEDAFKRAIKIGLSWMVLLGILDVGSGTGTREAADRSFLNGQEDFEFERRSSLPETVYDRIQRAKADVAGKVEGFNAAKAGQGIVSSSEQLRVAGYNQQQIDAIRSELATQDIIPTLPQ
jgi:hypothetical protein